MLKLLKHITLLTLIPVLLVSGTYWVKTKHVCQLSAKLEIVQPEHKEGACSEESACDSDCISTSCCSLLVTSISPGIQNFTPNSQHNIPYYKITVPSIQFVIDPYIIGEIDSQINLSEESFPILFNRKIQQLYCTMLC